MKLNAASPIALGDPIPTATTPSLPEGTSVARVLRALGRHVRSVPGEGADAGYADCPLGVEHGPSDNRGTLRVTGARFSCEASTCRNQGDTNDLLAYLAGKATCAPPEEPEADARLRQLHATVVRKLGTNSD